MVHSVSSGVWGDDDEKLGSGPKVEAPLVRRAGEKVQFYLGWDPEC